MTHRYDIFKFKVSICILILVLITFLCSANNKDEKFDYVCFEHVITGVIITDCIEIKNDSKTTYNCSDIHSSNLIPFNPGSKWKVHKGDESICKNEKKSSDVPR